MTGCSFEQQAVLFVLLGLVALPVGWLAVGYITWSEKRRRR